LQGWQDNGVLFHGLPNYAPVGAFVALMRERIASFYSLGNPALWLPVAVGAVACGLCFAMGQRRALPWLLIPLCAVDLLFFSYRWNLNVPYGQTYPPEPAAAVLARSTRSVGLRAGHPIALAPYGVKDAAGYETLYPARYLPFSSIWDGEPPVSYTLLYLRNVSPVFRKFADLVSVERIYCDPFTTLPDFAASDLVYRGAVRFA